MFWLAQIRIISLQLTYLANTNYISIMKKSGHADLPLHGGKVPRWLAERMSTMGGAILEAIILEFGKSEVLRRISDPGWFQSLGCVLGMDWHSSGITTSVLGALKSSMNPKANELGLYFCGGRGRHSKKTPNELTDIALKTGLNGADLVRSSKLTAKIDNNTIQDGYQIYLHSFIVSDEGEWSVVQQGMNTENGYARRYHWHSNSFKEFLDQPHTDIVGKNEGPIINLTDKRAKITRDSILDISREKPVHLLREISQMRLPAHHDVRQKDVDLKRLGAVLALAQETPFANFESFLLTKGLGPRTLQSLTLVSEVIYGTPSRFQDPARFSFAHGGKDGHPFPVPTKVYDNSINVLKKSIEKAKIGHYDKMRAFKNLHTAAKRIEENFTPKGNLDDLIEKERNESYKYGGRTVNGFARPPIEKKQLSLF